MGVRCGVPIIARNLQVFGYDYICISMMCIGVCEFMVRFIDTPTMADVEEFPLLGTNTLLRVEIRRLRQKFGTPLVLV